MNKHAFYPTSHEISKLLVEHIPLETPENLIDLGAGDGSLLKAAYQKWNYTELTASEIDVFLCKDLLSKMPKLRLFQGDSLKLISNNKVVTNSFDVAVCNPPYLKYQNCEFYQHILRNVGFEDSAKYPTITSDLLFLAKNLMLLKAQGHLGIILPDSMITGDDYKRFRSELLSRHKVYAVIQLPERIFNKTDALTHIIYIEKGNSTENEIPLFKADHQGKITHKTHAKVGKISSRLDFKYWQWVNSNNTKTHSCTLGDIVVSAVRGNTTHKTLKSQTEPYFHTTSFKHFDTEIKLTKGNYKAGLTIAEKGDILIARVGSRCIGKVAKIDDGSISITDCIYRVRVPSKYQDRLLRALTSKKGQAWFNANAKGVGARLISKTDLMQFPLDFPI